MKTLLQLTVGCALALAMAPAAQAQLLADDPFLTGGSPNYTAGDINGQNPAVTGFTGAWFQDITPNSGTVSATPLSYSGTTGYITTPGAGSLDNSISNTRTGRAFTAGVTSAFTATSGTVYMSFELQLTNVTGYQAVELSNNSDPSRFLQIGYSTFGDFANQATNFGVTLNNTGGGGTTGILGAANTNVHLFVLQLNLTAGTDTMNVWEDPTNVTGAAPTGGTEVSLSGFTVANTPNFLTFASFGGGSGGTKVSEIRIGTTLASVAAVPEVPTSSLTLLGLSALMVVMVRRKLIA
jgi:hypothetical protein